MVDLAAAVSYADMLLASCWAISSIGYRPALHAGGSQIVPGIAHWGMWGPDGIKISQAAYTGWIGCLTYCMTPLRYFADHR